MSNGATPAAVLVLALAVALALPATARAHGTLQAQIDAATAQIERNAADPKLYLRRGELHRQHEDWKAALADCDRAAELAPGLDAVDLLRGRVLVAAGRPAEAVAPLDGYLGRHPDHVEALLTRARALGALARYEAAAADYTRAIERQPRPDPEDYLQRARLEQAAGQVERALAGLDAGIAKLGPVPSLQREAIDLEVRQGRVEAALARLDALAARSPRKEGWLAQRGDILLRFDRPGEARAAYAGSLAAIESLPPQARSTKAIADLEARVRESLARL